MDYPRTFHSSFRVINVMSDFEGACDSAAKTIFNLCDDDLLACQFYFKQLIIKKAHELKITNSKELGK